MWIADTAVVGEENVARLCHAAIARIRYSAVSPTPDAATGTIWMRLARAASATRQGLPTFSACGGRRRQRASTGPHRAASPARRRGPGLVHRLRIVAAAARALLGARLACVAQRCRGEREGSGDVDIADVAIGDESERGCRAPGDLRLRSARIARAPISGTPFRPPCCRSCRRRARDRSALTAGAAPDSVMVCGFDAARPESERQRRRRDARAGRTE